MIQESGRSYLRIPESARVTARRTIAHVVSVLDAADTSKTLNFFSVHRPKTIVHRHESTTITRRLVDHSLPNQPTEITLISVFDTATPPNLLSQEVHTTRRNITGTEHTAGIRHTVETDADEAYQTPPTSGRSRKRARAAMREIRDTVGEIEARHDLRQLSRRAPDTALSSPIPTATSAPTPPRRRRPHGMKTVTVKDNIL